MLTKDLAYDLRSLVKRPGFTFLLVLILALGIGFVTAVFSLAHSIFLSAVPFEDPDRIVMIHWIDPEGSLERITTSYLNYRDLAEHSRSFAGIAGFVADFAYPLSLIGGDYPEQVSVSLAEAYYFKALNIRFTLGRPFSEAECGPPHGEAVVILSHGLWESRFGGDPEVLGKTINLSGYPYTIVGVLDKGIRTLVEEPGEIMIPVRRAALHTRADFIENRAHRWLYMVGRLKPDVTLSQAQAELDSISRQLQTAYPEENGTDVARGVPFSAVRSNEGDLSRVITMLAIGAGFVFSLCCINVILLLLARFVERLREFAVRMALGIGRGSLILQSLIRDVLMALAAGVLGFLLAFYGIKIFLAMTPLEVANFIDINVDARAFLASLLAALLAALLFGVVPAWHSRQIDLQTVLRPAGAETGGLGRNLIRRILIIAQVALSVIVLVGAGLMIRSFYVFSQTDYGFDTEGLVFMHLNLNDPRYRDPDARRAFYRTLEQEISALPGVIDAGLWGPRIPGRNWVYREIIPEGRDLESTRDRVTLFAHAVTPGAVEKLGIRLIEGRMLAETDHENAPPAVVLSESAARLMWPGESALGKRISNVWEDQWFTVVGVVSDSLQRGRGMEFYHPEDFYATFYQVPIPPLSIFVRTKTEVPAMIAMIRKVVRGLDGTLPVFNVRTMEDIMVEEGNELRAFSLMMTLLAITAALLSTLGIYGIMSYAASRRSREIGIRVALGVEKRGIAAMMLKSTIIDMAIGIGIGIAGAFYITRILASLLHGVTTTDPFALAMVAVTMIAVGAVATFMPTRKALAVNPIDVLRYE